MPLAHYNVSTILDIPNTQWRDRLMPASFRNQQFHCEVMNRANGRHIVTHEFPKRDLPYSEDMGRRAYEFTVRGYFIAYPYDSKQPLYQRNYQIPRNNLLRVLEDGQPGLLQLPTLPPIYVQCTRYSLTEEEKIGGYCVFDMAFVEYGLPPTASGADTFTVVASNAQTLKQRVMQVLAQGPAPIFPINTRQPLAPINPPQVPPPS
jgi:DNA circularisation protein